MKTQTITQETATKAFAAWETAYRASPEAFYTPEEVSQLEEASLAESRAIHFMALLRSLE